MIRSLMLLSSLSYVAVSGGLARFGEQKTLNEDRRRSDLEEHEAAMINIAVQSGFDFRRCVGGLPWGSFINGLYARIYSGVMQGMFMNFDSADRRRMGFNIPNFLENVAAEAEMDCSQGEAVVVESCTEKAEEMMMANSDAAKAQLANTFSFLASGAEGLVTCALAGAPGICQGWYNTLCASA